MMKQSFLTIAQLIADKEASLQTGPFGTQLKASDYVAHGTPVINVRNVGFGRIRDADLEYVSEGMTEKLHQHRLKKNDIVFGRKGAVERHALIDEASDGWIQGSDCLRLRIVSRRVNNKYLSYYFTTSAHKDWMEALCSFGATMSSLNQDIVKRISFPSPAIEVQNKIAAILSTYDDLIENNQRRITLLEKMAEEIYREWFVRFRFPGYEQVTFERGMPEGWKTKRFGDFCRLKRGYDLPDSQIVVGDFPVIASTSIKAFHSEFKVRPPVITTGRSGSLGQVLWINEKAWPLNTALYVQDFCGNSPYLVFFTLKNMGLENFNSGAGVPSLNRNHLNGIPIAVPSKEIQTQFDTVISPIFLQKESLSAANQLLIKKREALLPRLISAKLCVENLNIQFPPSMQDAAP